MAAWRWSPARLAADFIAAGFRQAGLAPCCNGSYLQEFPLVAPVADPTASHLLYQGQKLAYTGTFSQAVDLRAPLVFAGYGITAPEYRYDDYRGIDAKGKVVVIFEREPQEANPTSVFLGTGLTKHVAPRGKRLNAQAHGAVAVLVIPSPRTTTAPAASDRTPRRGGAPLMLDEALRIPMLTLTRESARQLVPKYTEVQAELDRTLRPVAVPLAGEVELRLRNRVERQGVTWNVIGVLPGRTQETVLLTSHYDHLPARDTGYYPGANDNGSGTVAVLELARRFAARKQKPRRTLVFVSFGAEEEGLLGAYHYVAHPPFPLAGTKAVINLDMIGRDEAHTPQTEGRVKVPADTRRHLNVLGGAYFPGLLKQLRRANTKVGLELDEKYDHDSSQNALYRCDHFPFLVAGVPDLWLFAGWHPGYHEPTDTLDLINWDKMERVTQLAFTLAERLAR
ncbi:MAG: M20/M25/M40 family metallo-hydrolase [Bryobacteraceae bacterium]|nr:M20/M25/M40 family metallo-hydrolase [Bryobacteraceae bacterium]